MTIVFMLTLVGLLLLATLIFPLIHFGTQPGEEQEDTVPGDSMLTPEGLDRASKLGESVFSLEDLKYVSEKIPSLRKRFIRERREIALRWISQRVAVARTIMRLHRTITRTSEALNPLLEIRLAGNYFVFVGTMFLARYLVWLWGPFTTCRLIARLLCFGNRLRPVSEVVFSSIDPMKLREVRDQWATQSRTS